LQGDPRVVELLNRHLTFELTAINQYFLNARMCDNWGYARLAKRHRELSLEEMRDTEERTAVGDLNGYVATCVEVGDQGTREFLAGMIAEEERHLDWWETQLAAVEQIGEAHYLAQQLRD
jgi:bacterioferritin